MCESCVYYQYDDEDEAWYCVADMDEDDYARFISSPKASCPLYRLDDEYAVVRHQM
ncbi:MAG: DUF6472 family protein [Lachnospiraceae bacterium]